MTLEKQNQGKRTGAIVIAASTGGPQALETLFAGFGQAISEYPVYVVLHMPDVFTGSVTTRIQKIAGRKTRAAKDGKTAEAGRIYFAPGNKHLVLTAKSGSVCMHLDDSEPVNFCKPSANKLFSSAAKIYGSSLIAIVLSGTGSDGCAGAIEIANAGGLIIAQDQETSAAWGMPASVIEAGAASRILPIDLIAGYTGQYLAIQRRGAAA